MNANKKVIGYVLTWGTTDGQAHRRVFKLPGTQDAFSRKLLKSKKYTVNSMSAFLEYAK